MRTQILLDVSTGGLRREAALILMLSLLVIVGQATWFIRIPVTILSIYGLMHGPARNSGKLWMFVFGLLSFECWYLWFEQDNHKYLIAYVSLAIGLSCDKAEKVQTIEKSSQRLSFTSRQLVALCFLIAVVAKLCSPSYRSGDFFFSTLATDPRFRAVATNVIGLDKEVVRKNLTQYRDLFENQELKTDSFRFSGLEEIEPYAYFLTYWTIVIESSIAICFLMPRGTLLSRFRNILLFAFIVSTYSVANVIGFGWILAVLGLLQLEDDESGMANAYFLMVILLHIYRVPFAALWNNFIM